MGQAFGLAGLSGVEEKFTDSPCARGVLFFVEGETLFETTVLNLTRLEEQVSSASGTSDAPAWEMDNPFEDGRTIPLGPLDYLTWQNRRILLIPAYSLQGLEVREATLAPGLRLDSKVLNPMKSFRRDEKRGWLPRRFSEDRALWRDSVALFRLGIPDQRPPQVFDWLAELAAEGFLDPGITRSALALGMANDQAKVDFIRAEKIPVPLAYLRNNALVESLAEALQMAEAASRQLWGAARTMATILLSFHAGTEGARQPLREDLDSAMGPWSIERRFWSHLETPFHSLIEELPRSREIALDDWRRVLVRHAWEAFDAAAEGVGSSPRALKAVVRGRDQLAAGLANALPVQALATG